MGSRSTRSRSLFSNNNDRPFRFSIFPDIRSLLQSTDRRSPSLSIDRASIHLFGGSDRPLRTNRDRSVFNWLSRSSKRVPSVGWSSGRASGR
ncbi:MAG: hypothetical protein HC832_04775 [Leptolyngbyaceae cyanobacterium RM1_405_57]|nr:hypothetical protein [Leptolyngbyaceae cyanobacterium RM1_405_57]